MNNKPQYHLLKNAKYAIDGLRHALKTEQSLRLEFLGGVIVLPMIYIISASLEVKLLLLITAFLIVIAELLNSAVENVVDLVTSEYAPLAKTAKDIGSSAVLFAVILHIICWVIVVCS